MGRAEVRTLKDPFFQILSTKKSTPAIGFINTSTLATVTNVYR
jgi:hypothetical protein